MTRTGVPTWARRGSIAAALVLVATVASCSAKNDTTSNAGGGGTGTTPGTVASGRCGTETPPEVQANAGDWPLPNADLVNSRSRFGSRLKLDTVGGLQQVWSYDVEGKGMFGNLTTTPIVQGSDVYVGALDGSVHKVDLTTGARRWAVPRSVKVFGPAGVAVGWGKVYGIDGTAVLAAHDSATGEVRWRRNLEVAPGNQIDMAPTLLGRCVLVSTQGLAPGSRGTLYAVDEANGEIIWSFETVPDDFWGDKKRNNGGGAWYPPAVDSASRTVYWGTSNPWPSPGTTGFPAGASRPGDNLYTNSAVALDVDRGTMRWYRQVFPHDIWDRDMVLTQLVDLPAGGRVLVHTGKGGRVIGLDPATGELRWDTSVGKHQNDDLTTYSEATTALPGVLGGVETPPAAADGTVYVAVVNSPSTYESPEVPFVLNAKLGTFPGNLIAIDAATGVVKWQVDLPGDALGGVTVVNDLLLTSTYQGQLLAYDRASGREVWRHDAGGFVNGWPAVAGDTIVWPVSGGEKSRMLAFRLPS